MNGLKSGLGPSWSRGAVFGAFMCGILHLGRGHLVGVLDPEIKTGGILLDALYAETGKESDEPAQQKKRPSSRQASWWVCAGRGRLARGAS